MRTQAPARLGSVDLLRGLVMVLMALDHARYFLHEAQIDPTDAARTTLPLFFTRWVTHFCAPVFMLLAGVGARLSLARGRTMRSLSGFLLTRGLWLIVLEATVARAGWQFNFDYGFTGALVLWALGGSMICLAALVWAGPRVAGAIGALMIALHDTLDRIHPDAFGALGWLWSLLHAPSTIHVGPHAEVFVLYPLVPWIGVMACGYALGDLVGATGPRRDRAKVALGVSLFAAFVLLRAWGGYGDPSRWRAQATGARTVLSFLATTKYPPSLCFLLMTLGPAIALLPWLDRRAGAAARVLSTLGRVPLFFWLLHVPLLHLVAVVLSIARGGHVARWLVDDPPAPRPDDYGYGLVVVYAVTFAAVAALYPACAWFAALKARRRDAWLSYL